MSANAMKKISQKEYLKKYLSGEKKKKKKDKKHKLKNATKVRIIDDDAATAPQPDIDEELLLTGEDAPQIVATYIEENPKGEEKKWKSIAVKEEPLDDVKPTIKVEEDLWGPKATDRRYRDEFSPPNRKSAILPLPDLVPQIKSIKVERESSREWHRRSISGERKKERDSSTSEKKKLKRSSRSKKTERNSNEFDKRSANSRSEMSPASDQSPPRRRRQGGSADQSPRRQRRKDSSADHSPSYRQSKPSVNSALGRKRRDDSSDQNPFRRKPVSSVDQSSPQRERYSSDQSPPRRRRRDRSEDQSPPRRRRRDSSADQSPQRRGKDDSSDQSPPRRKRNKSDSNLQHRQRISRSAHRSPQHRARERTPSELKAHGRIKMEKPSPDLSPKRRHNSSRENNFRYFKREISPPQESPERKMRRSPDRSSSRREKREAAHSTSPPPTHKPTAATKTLDGKRAGLQDAQSLRQELQELRRREEEMFAKLPAELSGRDAEVQVRDYGRRGKKAREAQQIDPEEQLRKEAHEKKKKELYDRWGKGLKQIEAYRAKVEDDIYEGSKPLARYSNDADLERRLREQERIDDPMLEYMRKKRRQEQKQADVPTIPIYQGSYPENRFGIRPGYRWDGVDRSNGYEQKWFAKQSEKRAVEEEAYKYSVEDM